MIGQSISHYRIESKLGEGAMGEVYLAQDLRLQRQVAIKFLSLGSLSNAQSRARFEREAQAAAALDHPNICTVHEIDEEDGSLFIVMAYLKGQDLGARLEEGRPTMDEALGSFQQMLEGVCAAHRVGVIHRDLKPANVMIEPDGRAVLTDFGLAKRGDSTQMTQAGTTMGTAAYMSPEQAQGLDLDGRSDLWSMGVILYEMLAGQRPYKGENLASVLYAIVHDDPPKLRELQQDLPDGVVDLVDGLLQRDLRKRYQNAATVLADLKKVRQGQGLDTAARTVGVVAQPKTAAAFRAPLRGIAVVAAIVALGLALWRLVPGLVPGPVPEPEIAATSLPSGIWPMEQTAKVAISGFRNDTGDPLQDGLGTLATETLVNELTATGMVEVVPVDLATGEARPDAQSLAQSVGADISVSGRFYRLGEDVLRFQPELYEVSTGTLIFAMPAIECDPDAPLGGMEHLKQRVLGAIGMYTQNRMRDPLPKTPPSYSAFEVYQNSWQRFDTRTLDDTQRMIGLMGMQRAQALDPTFLRPLVDGIGMLLTASQYGLADSILTELEPMHDRFDDFERSLLRAYRLMLNRDFPAMVGELERSSAIAGPSITQAFARVPGLQNLNRHAQVVALWEGLNVPRDVKAGVVGSTMMRTITGSYHAVGDYDGELQLCRDLVEVAPDHLLIRMQEATPWAAQGRLDEVRRILEDCLALPGGRGFVDWALYTQVAPGFRAHGYPEMAVTIINEYLDARAPRADDEPHLPQNKAALLYHAERFDEAAALFEELSAVNPRDLTNPLFLSYIAARQGRTDEARASFIPVIEEYEARFPQRKGTALLMRASFHALVGEKEAAVTALREAAVLGQEISDSSGGLYHDYELMSLHGYPPFEALFEPR